MSQRPIMDAGPGINFFSLNQERLLFDAIGPLCAPEAVQTEILRKARQDQRFAGAKSVWEKLPPKYMEVLSDDKTDELAKAVRRISSSPFDQRILRSADLGETMVIAHAVVAAEAGKDVIVLIDDGGGCLATAKESSRLQRLRNGGQYVGSIRLINTVTVLERAAGGKYLPDKNAMRQLYGRMKKLDDGLLPLASTTLMNLPCWT